MAIYNNREVTVIGPMPMASTVESITIEYKDGTHESVKLSSVRFTEDEKKALVKAYPSRYDGVDVVTEDDVKAVRIGAAPSYDPDYRAQAEAQARTKRQQEETQKRMEEAKKEADKRLQEELDKPTDKGQVVESTKKAK